LFISVRCRPDLEGAVAGVEVLLADPVFFGGIFEKYEGVEVVGKERDLILVNE